MRIIHFIDSLEKVNFGVWSAALIPSKELKEQFGIETIAFYPNPSYPVDEQDLYGAKGIELSVFELKAGVNNIVNKYKLNPETDIICTHGSWRYPTKWAYQLSIKGFKWVYCPQGMLEPWSMAQKAWLKKVYLKLVEGPSVSKCTLIRAVSSPEMERLKAMFPKQNIAWIPNGSNPVEVNYPKTLQPRTFLFISRINKKKGIIPLVKAWKQSALFNKANEQLIIAGPDDGDLVYLKEELNNQTEFGNIRYLGPVFGPQKQELLQMASFFCLPTVSEGFPSSIVEALHYGVLPITTQGANFPELFKENLAIDCGTTISDIIIALDEAAEMDAKQTEAYAVKAQEFARIGFSVERIAQMQAHQFSQLLKLRH